MKIENDDSSSLQEKRGSVGLPPKSMPKHRKSAPLVPNRVADLDSVNEGLGRLYTGRGGQPGSGILHGPEATTAVSLFPSVMRILSRLSLS